MSDDEPAAVERERLAIELIELRLYELVAVVEAIPLPLESPPQGREKLRA